MPSVDVRQIDDKYHLWFEGELLGVFDSLREVADEMLRTVIPKFEEEQRNERDSNQSAD